MIPDKKAIEQAHDRIRPYIHRTPVMTSHSLDEMAGCQVFFKCENLQKVGAFKARGAMNAVLSLSREEGVRKVWPRIHRGTMHRHWRVLPGLWG